MRNLLEFLAKFGTFFLFLLLEALSLFLIIRFDEDKNRVFLSSSNAAAGYLLKNYDAVADYLSIPKQMAMLQQENMELRSLLSNAYYNPKFELDTTLIITRKPDSIYYKATALDSFSLKDTLITQVFSYVPAKVISNSINLRNNTLTIDRGAAQGITPRMGVIGPQGLAGIVRNVSDHYATVVSLLHSDIQISAAIQNKGYFGTLVWNEPDPRYMNLGAIPKHAPVEPGDTVITSGFSGIFPGGIAIGTVASVNRDPGDNFHRIKVRLSGNLSNVGHVYVVQNKWYQEFKNVRAEGGKQ
jgi:rod shape-determining protein MreC